MVELDGDNKGLVDGAGKKAKRDIVQFVPYSTVCICIYIWLWPWLVLVMGNMDFC
jgi:hypothetical protein